ncbi:MAG: histidine kinase dimerization/phospho-acceptor domain-containing protein [Sarcina sp.]
MGIKSKTKFKGINVINFKNKKLITLLIIICILTIFILGKIINSYKLENQNIFLNFLSQKETIEILKNDIEGDLKEEFLAKVYNYDKDRFKIITKNFEAKSKRIIEKNYNSNILNLKKELYVSYKEIVENEKFFSTYEELYKLENLNNSNQEEMKNDEKYFELLNDYMKIELKDEDKLLEINLLNIDIQAKAKKINENKEKELQNLIEDINLKNSIIEKDGIIEKKSMYEYELKAQNTDILVSSENSSKYINDFSKTENIIILNKENEFIIKDFYLGLNGTTFGVTDNLLAPLNEISDLYFEDKSDKKLVVLMKKDDLKAGEFSSIYKNLKNYSNKIIIYLSIVLIALITGTICIYKKKFNNILSLYRKQGFIKIALGILLIFSIWFVAYSIFNIYWIKKLGEIIITLLIISDILYITEYGIKKRMESDYQLLKNIAKKLKIDPSISILENQKKDNIMVVSSFIILLCAGIVLIYFSRIAFWSNIIAMIVMVFVIVFAGAYIIVFRKRYFIACDLKDIERVSKEIANGNFEVKFNSEKARDLDKTREYLKSIDKGFKIAIEDELKSERMKSELLTNISHDLKTPLTSIINYVDLLQMIGITEDEKMEYLKILDNKSKRLKVLIEDLFEASKASTGNIKLNIENIDIVSVVRQSFAEFKEKIDSSDLEFRILLPDHKVNLDLDGARMWRVFENLIGNTLKYSMPRSRIYIALNDYSNKVVFEIKNISGYELNCDPNELKERFKRADISRHTEGSGLGLSIANSLVNLQGGKLDIIIDGDLFKVVIIFEK